MKLLAWPDLKREINVSFRFPGGDPPGVGPARRPSQAFTTLMTQRPTMIKSQGDSNLCASISVSNVLSYALRRYLLEENVIPDRDHSMIIIGKTPVSHEQTVTAPFTERIKPIDP